MLPERRAADGLAATHITMLRPETVGLAVAAVAASIFSPICILTLPAFTAPMAAMVVSEAAVGLPHGVVGEVTVASAVAAVPPATVAAPSRGRAVTVPA